MDIKACLETNIERGGEYMSDIDPFSVFIAYYDILNDETLNYLESIEFLEFKYHQAGLLNIMHRKEFICREEEGSQ